MKRFLLLIITIVFCFQVSASDLALTRWTSSEPDDDPITNTIPKKLSYFFSMEFGNYFGMRVGFTAIAVNGINFSDKNTLGIGIGHEIESSDNYAIPFFINYRHYFHKARRVQPLANIGIGGKINYGERMVSTTVTDPVFGTAQFSAYMPYTSLGLYATIGAGFRAGAFTFVSGFFFKTAGYNNFFNGGLDIKVGFTF